MSHLREQEANTQLMPAMFRNGLDRRTSARIPLAGAVRMGPPSGDPYAAVSARDVSPGGLFIDADRPVKLGARFSAEIVLGNGERIYVPEAEVAYNREHSSGSGFGVRFVDPSAEIIEAIEREIEKTREAVARVPTLPPVSTFEVLDEKMIEKSVVPVLVKPASETSRPAAGSPQTAAASKSNEPGRSSRPTAIRQKDIETDRLAPSLDENATEIFAHATISSLPREPELADDAFDVESSMPEEEPAWWEDWMRVGHDLKARVLERSRRVPLLWTVLATTGAVLVVSAIGLALWSGTRAEAVEPVAAIDRGVTAGTHQALMGDHAMPDVVIPKRVAAALEPSSEAKKPLPPLVYVEEVEKKAAAEHGAPAVATAKVEPKAEIMPVAMIETKSAPKTEPKAADKAETKSAPKTEPKAADKAEPKAVAKAEPKAVAKAEPKAAAKAIAKVEPKAAVKVAAKVESKPAAKSREAKTKIALASSARVLKTHVLRAPDRFVIDVAGQDKIPALPGASGAIKSIRFGKHPDFARIVIETNAPIENGRASKKGAELSVAIELR